MKNSFLQQLGILCLTLFAGSPLLAASPLTNIDKACVCNTSVQDPLEEPQSFNYGKFQGQCIDSCRFRAARVLENDKNLVVGNILHFGNFYKATIPWENFSKVEMGFEEFLPGISHVFLRFTLADNAPAIKLVNQVDPSKETIETRAFVISSEGVPPKDHKYSLFESYFGHYLLAHRVVTADELTRWISQYKHPVEYYPLKADAKAVGKILFKGIEDSDKLRLQNIYALFSNNCSTSAFGFIDSEIAPSKLQSAWEKFQEALPIAGPIGTRASLKSRNLTQ